MCKWKWVPFSWRKRSYSTERWFRFQSTCPSFPLGRGMPNCSSSNGPHLLNPFRSFTADGCTAELGRGRTSSLLSQYLVRQDRCLARFGTPMAFHPTCMRAANFSACQIQLQLLASLRTASVQRSAHKHLPATQRDLLNELTKLSQKYKWELIF